MRKFRYQHLKKKIKVLKIYEYCLEKECTKKNEKRVSLPFRCTINAALKIRNVGTIDDIFGFVKGAVFGITMIYATKFFQRNCIVARYICIRNGFVFHDIQTFDDVFVIAHDLQYERNSVHMHV